MCHKRNIFSALFVLCFVYSCQMDKKTTEPPASTESTHSAEDKAAEQPTVLAILDGRVVLTDSTFTPIPHWADKAYTIFYCVRHAEKRKDQGDNPELTEEGMARAQRLGLILSQERLDMAFSTNFKRTVQTAEEVRRQAEKAPPGSSYPPSMQDVWLDETLRTGAGKRFLVVGHQNTVPQLLNRLTGTTEFQDIPDNDHGRLYVAVSKGIGETEVLEFRY
ncbi:MAG: histidine phosphatase family protein [Saprospiraceae bacterium]|nr:histidine phosphatase family protein [Saprospiraceae bacterium]